MQGFVVEKAGKIGWNEVYLWSHKVVQKKTRKGRKQIGFMAVNSSSFFFTFLYDKKRIINSYQKPFLHVHHIKIFERNKIDKEKWCLKCLVKFLFSRP